MMFFQGMLLLGYLYAHLSARWLPVRVQVIVQMSLLVCAVFFLPFKISVLWQPENTSPTLSLLSLLTNTLAFPLLAITASSPLLQRWFVESHHLRASDPYFLFSASNVGSLVALFAFIFILEPWLALSSQSVTWQAGFVFLAVLTFLCGISVFAYKDKSTLKVKAVKLNEKVSVGLRLYWMLLSFLPSSLLLGTTTYITTDLASVPLFWVIPLMLNALAFIIAFSSREIIPSKITKYSQSTFLILFLITLFQDNFVLSHFSLILLHFSLYFFTCMACLDELVRCRPHHKYLTEFYLLIAFGGFLGGTFNALIAPILFHNVLEYPIMMLMAVVVKPPFAFLKRIYVLPVAIVCILFLSMHVDHGEKLYTGRNFFGTSTVFNRNNISHALYNGTTLHGIQQLAPNKQREIISFYYPMVDIVDYYRSHYGQLHIGVVGLGAGVTACLAGNNDVLSFYEINPDVVVIAQNPDYFTYLKLCPAKGGIKIGDARLQLKREENNTFDLIILDAFSSDAIPVHLLTREAVAMYFEKLKPGGVLCLHISNRYIDLTRVISAIAYSIRAKGVQRYFLGDLKKYLYASRWVILSRSQKDIDHFMQNQWKRLPFPEDSHLWTDDYSNILREIH